jgi:hypothetical protein
MKTKTSIYHRYFAFAYVLLVAVIFCGCETKNVEKRVTEYEINGSQLQIYVIDSCEYIGFVYGVNSDKLTHKGNCKFCVERSKK